MRHKKSFTNSMNSLLVRSKELLEKGGIEDEEFNSFKKECTGKYRLIIKQQISPTLTELALGALTLEVTEVKNPILRFVYNLFNSKTATSHKAPFLVKHTKSDNYKKYLFWTQLKLEGLLYNLEREEF